VLRKARLIRGKSIEAASRETHIRAEYLQALERERFEALLGDVYVRGFLRSYSTYLGLDADRVLTVYNQHFGGPGPTLPDPSPAPVRSPTPAHPHLPEIMRHHLSWAFLTVVAVLVLAVFGAVGLLARSHSALPAAPLGQTPAALPSGGRSVTVAVHALEPVEVAIHADGAKGATFLLRANETRTFAATSRLEVRLDRGKSAELIVNGQALGPVGKATSPFDAIFGPQDYRRSTSGNSP
jgi:hypothetical protein